MSKRKTSNDNLLANESFGGGGGGGCGSRAVGGALFGAGSALALGGGFREASITGGLRGLGSYASCKGWM
jgi:hypothetical protein